MPRICQRCKIQKNNNEFIKRNLSLNGRTGLCKACKSNDDKKYRKNNKEKVANYFKKLWSNPERKERNKLFKEISRFGLNASEFVENGKCELCNITNKQHIEKWGQRLQIHHIDNKGRHNQSLKKNPNNKKNNLRILCKSCHVKIDNPLKDYTGRGRKAWITRRLREKING